MLDQLKMEFFDEEFLKIVVVSIQKINNRLGGRLILVHRQSVFFDLPVISVLRGHEHYFLL
jgi:hypothetical protein